jgi:histidine triad (HIT) family protein
MKDSTCIFCRIAQKQVPATLIYEDEKALAFLDIRPLSEGHTLIIPKAHYETVFDIPQELITYLYGITQKVALAVKKATEADGISIIQQNGETAGQEICHLHIHIIPRYEGKKLLSFSEVKEADREKLSQTAAKIRKYL